MASQLEENPSGGGLEAVWAGDETPVSYDDLDPGLRMVFAVCLCGNKENFQVESGLGETRVEQLLPPRTAEPKSQMVLAHIADFRMVGFHETTQFEEQAGSDVGDQVRLGVAGRHGENSGSGFGTAWAVTECRGIPRAPPEENRGNPSISERPPMFSQAYSADIPEGRKGRMWRCGQKATLDFRE